MSKFSLLSSVNTDEKLERFSSIENSDNKLSEIHKSLSTEATNKTNKIMSLASTSIAAAAGVFIMPGFTDFVNVNKNVQNNEICEDFINEEFESLLLSSSDDLKCFSSVKASGPLNHNPYGSDAYSYLCAGELDEALKAAKKAIELDPKFARGYGYMGAAYKLKRKYTKAIEALKRGFELDGNDEFIRSQLNELLNFAKAEVQRLNSAGNGPVISQCYLFAAECFEAAIHLDPKNLKLYESAASAYSRACNHKKALNVAKKLTGSNPKYARGFLILGRAYALKKDYRKALEAYKKGIELDGSDKSLQMEYNSTMRILSLRNLVTGIELRRPGTDNFHAHEEIMYASNGFKISLFNLDV